MHKSPVVGVKALFEPCERPQKTHLPTKSKRGGRRRTKGRGRIKERVIHSWERRPLAGFIGAPIRLRFAFHPHRLARLLLPAGGGRRIQPRRRPGQVFGPCATSRPVQCTGDHPPLSLDSREYNESPRRDARHRDEPIPITHALKPTSPVQTSD